MTQSELNEFLGSWDAKQGLVEKLETLQKTLEYAMQPFFEPKLKSDSRKDELIDRILNPQCGRPYIHRLVLVYMIHNYDVNTSHSVLDIMSATGLSSASVKRALGGLKGWIIRHPLRTGYTYNPERF